jgi:glucokinase
MIKNIISWDLGATKCAAALVEYDDATQNLVCKKSYTVKISSCASLDELILNLENGLDTLMRESDAICIGAAGYYDGENLQLEAGYPYPMAFASVAKRLGWRNFAVIHDYAPIVCATFTSYMQNPLNVRRLNNCPIKPFGRRVALGVGTGLGLKDGVLFENGDFWLGQNEIGHIGISTPPINDPKYQARHAALIRFLLSDGVLMPNEPLTFEKILTGQGMVRLYRFCYPAEKNLTPEELGQKLRCGEAKDVTALFAWYLGLFIGTVQLIFMPESGIWITGGVILNHLDIFDYPEFFQGVEATPGYLALRQQIPLGVLCSNEHAFMGGAYFATQKMRLKRLINKDFIKDSALIVS